MNAAGSENVCIFRICCVFICFLMEKGYKNKTVSAIIKSIQIQTNKNKITYWRLSL